MLRALYVCILLLGTISVQAADDNIFYKDWRLEKPFTHGLLVGLSFEWVESVPKEWNKAHPLEPAGIPSGMLKYIVEHKVIPFNLGRGLGLFFWLFLTLSFVYRYRHRAAWHQYHYLRHMAEDEAYRKSLFDTDN
jgi:hypothetical protein